MATKTKSNRRQDYQEGHEPLNDMADTARRNYEHAIRTGQKFQEEAGQWWNRVFTQAAPAMEWQKNFTRISAMAGNAMPLAQHCLEGAMDVMEKSGRNSAELMKQAVDAAQTSSLAESQAKWLEFWTASMKAAQSNVEAVAQLGTRAIDSWIDFVRKNSETPEARIPGAA